MYFFNGCKVITYSNEVAIQSLCDFVRSPLFMSKPLNHSLNISFENSDPLRNETPVSLLRDVQQLILL